MSSSRWRTNASGAVELQPGTALGDRLLGSLNSPRAHSTRFIPRCGFPPTSRQGTIVPKPLPVVRVGQACAAHLCLTDHSLLRKRLTASEEDTAGGDESAKKPSEKTRFRSPGTAEKNGTRLRPDFGAAGRTACPQSGCSAGDSTVPATAAAQLKMPAGRWAESTAAVPGEGLAAAMVGPENPRGPGRRPPPPASAWRRL